MGKLMEAQKNISESWTALFDLIPFYRTKMERKNIFAALEKKIIHLDKDESITENTYSNPNNPVVRFILYIFSMETFIKDEVFRA